MSKFSDWVDQELIKRNWTRADLARMSGVSQTAFSLVWKGDRNPGSGLCEAISKALGIPAETVFRAAGLLPQISSNDAEWEEWKYELSKLTPEKRASFLRMMRAESEYEAEQQRLREASKRRKTGPLPNL